MSWKWILGCSLALNVILAVALQIERSTADQPEAALSAPSASGTGDSADRWRADTPHVIAGGDAEEVDRAPKRKTIVEGPVESDHYPTFIRKLRALGLSEQSIATLVVGEVVQNAIDDQIALQLKLNTGEITQEEYQKQLRQLQKDREGLLVTLLGEENFRNYQINHDYQLRQLAQTGRFQAETLEKYYDARKKHSEAMADLSEKLALREIDQTEYEARQLALQEEYDAELNQALGADTARSLRAETDWQVINLRRQMQNVTVSNTEYDRIAEALWKSQREFQKLQSRQRTGEASWQDLRPQQEAIEEDKKNQIAAILGPDRYAEYEKQSDGTFQSLKRWGQPNNLTPQQVDSVYQAIKDWRNQQKELQRQLRDKEIKNEDYRLANDDLTAATRNSLSRYLGADAYERMKKATGQLP